MSAVTRGIEIDLRDGLREPHQIRPFPIEAGVLKKPRSSAPAREHHPR